jgi:hypothetical protein
LPVAGRRNGYFRVEYSCSDDTDPDPVTTATLNGVPVADGTRTLLITRWRRGHLWVGHTLIVWGPSFELTVTCTDASGNTTTVTAEPTFRS